MRPPRANDPEIPLKTILFSFQLYFCLKEIHDKKVLQKCFGAIKEKKLVVFVFNACMALSISVNHPPNYRNCRLKFVPTTADRGFLKYFINEYLNKLLLNNLLKGL